MRTSLARISRHPAALALAAALTALLTWWVARTAWRLFRGDAARSAALILQQPPGGTDYDFAQLDWVGPLGGEPARRAPAPILIALDPGVVLQSCPAAPGVYRLTLKSRQPARIRDYVAANALRLSPAATDGQGRASMTLPASLSRDYVGFVGVRKGPPGTAPLGVVCGVRLDVRTGSGEFALVFDPPRETVLEYKNLQPRPDNRWPISNLYLEDPARLAFDCALSHVDHRVALDGSDGVLTMQARPILPEDDAQMAEQLRRMQALLSRQVQEAAARPAGFDPRYLGVAANRLPNARFLLSKEVFARYAARVADGPVEIVELAPRLRVRAAGPDGWSAELLRSVRGWL